MLEFNARTTAADLVDNLRPDELHELYNALDKDDLCDYLDLIDRDDAGEHCTRGHDDE
jgi:Mg/Co/Ni transporter MgtE